MKLIYLTKWAVVALLLPPPFCFGQIKQQNPGRENCDRPG